MNTIELGKFGEDLACKHLLKNGHEIVTRNYRIGKGEIDIISKQNQLVVITEVKTRNSRALGEPYQSVTRRKQSQLIRLANAYLQENKLNEEVRFDVISIIHNRNQTDINHIQGAFYPIA